MDRLDAMSVLLAVVEEGSLSAGARRLRAPLPTVSRKVSELERHVRTKLLVRTSRRVGLTDAGRAYVDAARRILAQVTEAEQAAAGEYTQPRGEVSVTAPVAFGRLHVLPMLAGFLAEYPEIDVRLLLIDHNLNIVEGHVDVALRIGTLADSALKASRLGAVARVVCASPGYLARRGTPAVPDDLAAHDCVTFHGFPARAGWRFGEVTVPLRSRLAVNTAEAAVDAAAAGIGITRVLSYQAVEAIGAGTLTRILRAHEPAASPVSFVHNDQGLLPRKVRALLDWSVPRLRERLTGLA